MKEVKWQRERLCGAEEELKSREVEKKKKWTRRKLEMNRNGKEENGKKGKLKNIMRKSREGKVR